MRGPGWLVGGKEAWAWYFSQAQAVWALPSVPGSVADGVAHLYSQEARRAAVFTHQDGPIPARVFTMGTDDPQIK